VVGPEVYGRELTWHFSQRRGKAVSVGERSMHSRRGYLIKYLMLQAATNFLEFLKNIIVHTEIIPTRRYDVPLNLLTDEYGIHYSTAKYLKG
jgi:hypothetical protein